MGADSQGMVGSVPEGFGMLALTQGYLNLGSGQRPFAKPWLNVDLQEKWQPDLVCDCAHLPYSDGTCRMVVLHHVLEHYGCNEGRGVIAEAFRLLAPGGSLLVFVPDMRALAQRWLMHKLDTQVYMTNLYGAYMGDECDRHKWGFVRETLEDELWQQRWSEVKAFDWRPIPGADLARDFWILAIEAVR